MSGVVAGPAEGTQRPDNPPDNSPDNPLAGIGLLVAAIFALCLQDALAKLLSEEFAVSQILAFRGFSGLLLCLVAALAGRALLRVEKRLRLYVALRILCAGLAATALYTGLRTVPLAEATTLLLASPLIITGLTAVLLREAVGWRRWSAVSIGFVGCIIVLQPFNLRVELGAIIIMGGAFCWSMAAILTRKIGTGVPVLTQLFYLNLAFFLVSGAALPGDWRTPDAMGLALLLLLGVIGFVSQFGIILGYRLASPAVVAPFEYTALLWSALLGYLVWAEVPTTNVWIGAALIAGSGLYIAQRETRQRETRQRKAWPGRTRK